MFPVDINVWNWDIYLLASPWSIVLFKSSLMLPYTWKKDPYLLRRHIDAHSLFIKLWYCSCIDWYPKPRYGIRTDRCSLIIISSAFCNMDLWHRGCTQTKETPQCKCRLLSNQVTYQSLSPRKCCQLPSYRPQSHIYDVYRDVKPALPYLC